MEGRIPKLLRYFKINLSKIWVLWEVPKFSSRKRVYKLSVRPSNPSEKLKYLSVFKISARVLSFSSEPKAINRTESSKSAWRTAFSSLCTGTEESFIPKIRTSSFSILTVSMTLRGEEESLTLVNPSCTRASRQANLKSVLSSRTIIFIFCFSLIGHHLRKNKAKERKESRSKGGEFFPWEREPRQLGILSWKKRV